MKNKAIIDMTRFPLSFYILLCFTFAVMVSCDEETKQGTWEYGLEIKDTIKIDLPTNIPEIAFSSKWSYSNGMLSFITEQNSENQLFCYHFDQQKFKSYALGKLSKGLINHSAAYAFIDDSTLLYDQYFNSELLIVSLNTGQLKKSYTYDELYGVAQHSTLKFYSDSLSFIFPFMYLNIEDPLYHDQSRLAMIINKQNGESQLIGSYPNEIKINPEPRLNILIPDMICQKDQLVINFRAESKLWVYSIPEETIHAFPCEDKGVLYVKNRKLSGDDFKDAMKEELNGLYKSLLYDEKFHRYYRISISYPGFQGDLPSSNEEFEAMGKSRKVTVTVLDNHFNIIAQNTLAQVNENNPYIRDGILYMRQDLNSEEEMQFIGFELVDL